MSTFDIVLLVFLGLGAFKGYRNGLVVEIFSFLAFFAGLFLALELTIPVSVSLFGKSSYFDLIAIAVFIVLFVFLVIGIKAIARLIKNALDVTLLGNLDNFFGALFGALKWAFVLSVIFWVFDSVGIDIAGRYAENTVILPYIVGIGPLIFEWASILLPFLRDLINQMDQLSNAENTLLTFCSLESRAAFL